MRTLEHLKRLSSIKSNAGVKFLTPAAFPGGHCPLHTALALGARVKGMSTLVVGTAECGTYSRNAISFVESQADEMHWMYVLDSNEVVFGCRKGVIKTIKEMDSLGAKAIMIILTCVPEVIGEDVEGIMEEIQDQTRAKLTFVPMGHFRCNSYPSGYWKTLLAFETFMEQSKMSVDTVNVLGRSPRERHTPMPDVLKSLEKRGFFLRMLAPQSDIEDFIVSPDAALNIVVSPFMNPLAKRMKEKYDIPYISLHEYYGVAEIDNLYSAIEKELNIRFQNEFDEERQKAKGLEETVASLYKNKKYVMTEIGATMPLPLVSYLSAFEMTPLILHIDEFYPDDIQWAKQVNAQGHDPFVCHMVHEASDKALLKGLSTDVAFGELLKEENTLCAVPYLEDLYGQMGYERTVKLLEQMLESVKDGEGDCHGQA